MDLYIRALTIYPGVVTAYGCLLILDILIVLVNWLIEMSSLTFVSDILPYDGWRLIKPFKLIRNDVHRVRKRPSVVPTVLSGALVFVSAISISYCVLICDVCLLQYLYWGGLQLLLSLTLWYKCVQKYLVTNHHNEQLVVVEICQCLTDPFVSILLLQGYHEEYYTYVVPNSEHWEVGMYHNAACLGSYVVELDPENIPREKAVWIGVGDKLTRSKWNGCLFSILIMFVSIILMASYWFIDILSLLIVGAIMFALGILFMPWRITRPLKLVSYHRTAVYDDIECIGTYTYVFVGKNGRPYYYQCDEEEAFSYSGSYSCELCGNKISFISEHLPNEIPMTYLRQAQAPETWIFLFILACGVATCEFLGFLPGIIAGSVLFSLWLVAVLRYETKGDI